MSPRISKRSFLSFLPLLFLVPAVGQALTWNVPADAPTIAAGIDSAAAGDTVLVACNTYPEFGLAMKPGVVLRSATGLPDCVTIDGTYSGRIMVLTGADSTTVIEGITFAQGQTGSIWDYDAGSALRLNDASPRIRDCRFIDCQTGINATVLSWGTSAAVFERCEFSGNTAANSVGGIHINDSPGTQLIDCVFQGNSGVAGYGGAAMLWNAAADFLRCRFSGNSAAHSGAVRVSTGSVATFTECVFDGNQASGDGGCAIVDAATAEFLSCTFADNASPAGNGCLRIADATVTLQNTIVAFASPGPAAYCTGTNTLTVACSDIFGNAGGDWVDCLSSLGGMNGNISADPRFCDMGAGDLTLRAGSLCLNAPGCGLIGALPQGCSFRTWHVPSELATIQAAIDTSVAGDTVEVACGTYTWAGEGSGNSDGLIRLKPGVTFLSETRLPGCVTIDAQGNGRVLYLSGGTEATHMEGFTITGGLEGPSNGGGGACAVFPAGPLSVQGCDFIGNSAGLGGGLYASDGSLSFSMCVFAGNSAPYGAGLLSHVPFTATDCTFSGNTAGSDGGGIFDNSSGQVVDCLFYQNTAGLRGGAFFGQGSAPSLDGCTIWENSGGTIIGGAIAVYGAAISVTHTLVASSPQGPAVLCLAGGTATVTCCDVWGNAGGNWVGCLAGQLGTNGNISEDPRLCDPAGGDFRVSYLSPCEGGPCGRIGAFGYGCLDSRPWIVGITDVPDDQGRQVRLRWNRSRNDVPGDPLGITSYEIYRRQDAGIVPALESTLAPAAPPLARGLRLDGWDYVQTVPAHGDSIYQVVAPTLCDSTIAGGMCWTAFFVRAATGDPYVYLDSPPDSGYSVDNLAPAIPTSLQMAATVLTWDPCPDADFDYFTVYGSDTGDLGGAVVIGHTIEPSLDVASHPWPWYLVTATDLSGNEGDFAGAMNPATGVRPVEPPPDAFALRAARPNPFVASTVIAYDVPRAGQTSLQILDVQGRLVRTLVDRPTEPGRYAPVWDGRDDAGLRVAGGTYFMKLTAGHVTQSRKVVFLGGR